jgi:hypothetical protein
LIRDTLHHGAMGPPDRLPISRRYYIIAAKKWAATIYFRRPGDGSQSTAGRLAEAKLRRKKWAWLLVLLLAGRIVAPAQAVQAENTAPPGKSPLRKALERSLLFPGLGQLGEKQYIKAALFAGAEIFCLVEVLIFMGKGNDAYDKYRAATDLAAAIEFRSQTEKYDKRRNTAILAAAGVWVLNMIEIFVFAKKKYGKNAAVGFTPFYNHENKAIGAGLRFNF